MMHTRVEVKKKVEIISTRGPGENRQEIEQVQSMLERLEAHEAGEDHARMLRGTPLETNTENSFELKKKFASAQLFKPAKEANFDQMIANDCHAVLQEIQSGNQMGANRHTSIPVVGLSVNGNSEKGKENNGPSVYNQATPGGALGKLMRDYQEASHLGAGISSQTRDLIRNTLRIAGADNLESTITHQPGRALNTFFTNQG